jgi:hypothetical protein
MSDAYEPSDTPSQPRAKRGCMGRMFLILGIIAAVCIMLCCGAGTWIFFKIRGGLKQEPAEVLAVQEKIIDIDLPEEMRPAGGMDLDFFGVFAMQMAVFGDEVEVPEDQQGQEQASFRGKFLMLMQMHVAGQDPGAMEAQLQTQSNAQGVDIEVTSHELRTIEIDGREVEFDFAQGTNREDNTQIRMVRGAFPGRNGVVMLLLVVPEEQWNEEEVMTLLQSIRR